MATTKSDSFATSLYAIGGEIAPLMAEQNLSNSPLGPLESWSPALKSTVALMLRAGTQIVMFWGPELVAIYNDAYAPRIGDKHPRALGRPARENWAELWDDLEPLLTGVMKTGETFFSRDRPFYIERHGFGEATFWDVSYSAVMEADGVVGGVICIVTETTDRVRALEALENSERQLRDLNASLERRVADTLAERKILADIVEGTDALVQVADQDFRWLAVNRAAMDEFERVFGTRPAVGLSMLDVLAGNPEQQAAARAVWSRALSGEAFTEIQPFGDSSRDRRFYEMKFNVIRDPHGKPVAAYQFVYDVTERLERERRLAEAEGALHQAQKMEAVGQLTGGVAHDFNNLLTPIMGALDSLSRRLGGDERAQRLTAGALQAAERARVLVQRLLAFSRRQHLEARPIDTAKHVRGMVDMMERSLGPQVRLAVHCPDDLPPALVDPNQFELSLLNLAVNARDAMPGGGELRITVDATQVPAGGKLPPGDYVRIVVADTGIGMDAETLKRAVEPFFTTKGLGRGTGLGLSSVHGLAAQSGGDFELRSSPGRGTTATLRLPVSTAPAEDRDQNAAQNAASAQAQEVTVLLVDDEELVRTGTAAMLADAGYRVAQATSGRHALQLVESGMPFDVLVTDHAMPGISGVELARELRRIRPTIPVLMITGFVALSDAEASGLSRLSKPFRQSELAQAVAEQVERAKVIALRPSFKPRGVEDAS